MQPQGSGASARVLGTSEASELRALYSLTDRLYRAGSLEDVYDAALDAITDTLGCGRASINWVPLGTWSVIVTCWAATWPMLRTYNANVAGLPT